MWWTHAAHGGQEAEREEEQGWEAALLAGPHGLQHVQSGTH